MANMKKKKPTQKKLVELAYKYCGNCARIAQEIDYSRSNTWKMYQKSEKLKAALKEAKEDLKHIAEGKLHEKIMQGNTACIMFYLKTQCGYSERNKLEVETKPVVEGWEIDLKEFKGDEDDKEKDKDME